MKRFILAVAILVLVPSLVWAYAVESDHPRLFFTSDDLTTIRDKCDGYFSTEYAAYKSNADADSSSVPFSSASDRAWRIMQYSFIAQVEQDTTYVAYARGIADAMMSSSDWYTNPYYRHFRYKGLSIFYDWNYDSLSTWGKSNYGDSLAVAGEYILNNLRSEWAATPAHSGLRQLYMLAYPGIALHSDGIDDALAGAMCDSLRSHMYGQHQGAIAVTDLIAGDGAWYVDDYHYTYHRKHYQEDVLGYLWTAYLWGVATDDAPYEDSAYLSNVGNWLTYTHAPEPNWILAPTNAPPPNSPTTPAVGYGGTKMGDTESSIFPGYSTNAHTFGMIASAAQDPVLAWLVEEYRSRWSPSYNYECKRWYCAATIASWDTLLIEDAEDPETAGWPLAAHFDSMAMAVFRTGWDIDSTSTDIFAQVRAPRFVAYDGHMHSDAGHFVIYRGDDMLAVESGAYGNRICSHSVNYQSRTIAHNCPTIYMAGEDFDGHANDGGQRDRNDRLPAVSDIHKVSDITGGDHRASAVMEFSDATEYAYMKINLTPAYVQAKVDTITREFVWLKPDSGEEDTSWFVCFDRVSADSACQEKKWILHSHEDPTVTDSTLVQVDHRDSRLFVAPLHPVARGITEVEGFWVDGSEYPIADNDSLRNDLGEWRVEIAPTVAAQDDWFLVAMYACADTTMAMPTVTLVTREDNMIGCAIGESQPDTLWFGADGEDFVYSPWTSSSGGCPFVSVLTDRGLVRDNNILARRAQEGWDAEDYYVLSHAPTSRDGAYHLVLSEDEMEHSRFDRIALYVVDHEPGVEIALSPDGELRAYRVVSAPVSSHGGQVQPSLAALMAADHQATTLHAGSHFEVAFPVDVAELSDWGIGVEGRGSPKTEIPPPGGGRIVPEGNSVDLTLTCSRARSAVSIAPPPPAAKMEDGLLRVELTAPIDAVLGRVFLAEWLDEAVVLKSCRLTGARHAVLGDCLSSLTGDDSQRVDLRPDESIDLEFATPPVVEGLARDYVFYAEGFYTAWDGETGSADYSQDGVVRLSTYPNPFRSSTSIAFDVPSPGGVVAVNIYDASGRRVQQFLQSGLEPGRHSIFWDGSDGSGRALPSGVYFCRVLAPGVDETEKVLLLR